MSLALLTSHEMSRVSVSVDSLRTPVGFLLGAGNEGGGNKEGETRVEGIGR